MKFIETSKDGGPESTVWAYWLIELKGLFSIVLLRFEDGTREAYHSHAFNSVSWVLSGKLLEEHQDRKANVEKQRHFRDWKFYTDIHTPYLFPVMTYRSTTHKVRSIGRTWVLSFRGPWAKTWKEVVDGEERVLTSGRKRVA